VSATPESDETIVIKKYANRRLYDTSASAYVTLEHLCGLVRQGKNFVVLDARSSEDLTRSVLTQIIFEQENRREGVLPVSFLRQLIQLYGESVQSVLPAYLELSMQNFTNQQDKWRDYMKSTLGEDGAGRAFEEQIRKNMEIFEETMRFFSPFSPPWSGRPEPSQSPAPASDGASALAAMQKQLAEMQAQLNALARAGAPHKP